MDSKPEIVFKYEAFTLRAIKNLKRQSVYFGSPKNFNDPYDSALCANVRDLTVDELPEALDALMNDSETPEQIKNILPHLPPAQQIEQLTAGIRNAVHNAREDYLNTRGVTCFSECNDNLLMWSHYGGHHRGFCLEFRTDREPFSCERLRQVKYSTSIPEIDPIRFLTSTDFEQIMELLCTKSADWAYEREWRAIHRDAGTVYTYEPDALKAIYFGPEIENQDRDMICLILNGQNPDVELYRGFRSESEFRVEFEKFHYTSLANARRMGIA